MMERASIRIFSRGLIRIGFFLITLAPDSYSQAKFPSSPDNAQQIEGQGEGFMVRVAVEEMRLDAVVVDRKGRQITNLTAADFEVYQDGKQQEVTSCIYINNNQTEPEKSPALAKESKINYPFRAPMMSPDKVRRAIAFVVDDLSMDFGRVDSARRALEKFVKEDMQPGDLVAILQTSRGIGALQLFSSDKRELLAIIKSIRWSMSFGRFSQIMALSYCIRALQGIPGRKYLILMSSYTTLNSSLIPDPTKSTPRSADFSAYNLLADAALRSGVVIYTANTTGLLAPFSGGPWATVDISSLEISEKELPLSKKTGGISVKGSNFPISRVMEEIKGYYLISYIPPRKTFGSDKRGVYHRVQIKVKRPGCEVHTRDGFFGSIEPVDELARFRNTLREAIFSPFRNNDLKVNLAFGYTGRIPKGYLLRAWLHVDAGELNPIEEIDGTYSIILEVVCATSGLSGYIRDSGSMEFTFSIKKEHIDWIKEHGLRFSLSLPVQGPGAYYARVAVRDPRSGKIGSSYQFIEIPDLKKRRLSLSSVFVLNPDEDASWIYTGKANQSETVLQFNRRRDSGMTPALRNYTPGESFEYAAIIYNAETPKGLPPDLEYRYVLFRNGNELYKSEPRPIDPGDSANFKRIPIRLKVNLSPAVLPGDYALLLEVKDKQAKEKHSITTQALDFAVLPKE
ncbi:MAG: VWA domain-containing protein [Acidobacteria bacterium]|nr:VWA domain-containing protein [Acidobacteriota bacterium]